ncbi:S8 family peptidase [Niastella sp. OAS944]|uniref:S8 family peptidase n=1 Tax=Niastella sp. OAS944 TaxID=2664089 RepID=UPI00346D8670|nr:subtilisin family serine protease [Chitinophagaceae bacterium OAS944]
MRNSTPNGAMPAGLRPALICMLSFLIYASGYAQNKAPEDKIDPAFRFTFAPTAPGARQEPKTFSPAYKLTPTKVVVTAGRPAEDRYDCIIYTKDVATLKSKGVVINSVLPHFVTAWVTPDQIEQLSKLPTVNYIAAPSVDQLHNDIAVASTGASLLHQGKLNNTVYKGKGVIVAIFDSGIDWKHPDFRDPDDQTKSRILRIWDQTITPIAGESSPAGMGYGVEYTQAQINDELDGTPANYVREADINGHGTHVAGTAAGNGMAIPLTRKHAGMAPEADIVVIKGGDGSFSTTNIINGMTYLKNLATALGKPVVMNMSLGGQYGPHDGTRDYEIAVDNFTSSAAGRAVVISAGNDNGANIHTQLILPASGSQAITFNVPAVTTGTDVFEYRVYLNDNSNVSAAFSAPGTGALVANAGQSVTANVLSNGFSIYVYNVTDPGNGDRYIDVYVKRVAGTTVSPGGIWTLTLTNNTAINQPLHGWLYYKNPDFAATTVSGADNEYLVGSPGNANSAITVGAYVARPSWFTYQGNGGSYGTVARMDSIASFSSHGPRRDGVLKPEITATGQYVISALSSNSVPPPNDIIYPGRYRKNQGTSMSCPVVTGAVALLLQANPAATVSQLRNALFSNTATDVMTAQPGATPNTTYGYGKLDIFKAASSTFTCAPVDRKTYQYDASTITNQDLSVTLNTQRVAVRITPDISGKVAGAYYHPSFTKAPIVVEVRANNSGTPGALLGSMNVADTALSLYTWNYIDLSSLNIPVTSGVDYFMVIYRNPSSAVNWSFRYDAVNVDLRTLISTNGGASWGTAAQDYKIRSVVYTNDQLAAGLAMNNTEDKIRISATNLFVDNTCQLIAQLSPAGANPISDSATANVWIESSVPQVGGKPFVARHYQLTPKVDATTATGRVTLYFTQAEFDAFNADPNSTLNLPTGPADNAGKANLFITKYAGSSSDGSGLPASYSGTPITINPDDNDIVWNTTANRWEVSFTVSGFSGFFVQTDIIALPLYVESFSGYQKDAANVLNWKISCQNSEPVFDIQRSSNGVNYSSIGSTTATNGCNTTFNYKDKQPLSGNNYYRIKISDHGTEHYTRSILLQMDKALVTTIAPNVINKGESIQVSLVETEGTLRVMDATGRLIISQILTKGAQSITLPIKEGGAYFYNIQNHQGKLITGKLIVQ